MTLPARDPGRIVAAAVSPAFEGLFRAEYARVVGIAHRVLADQAEAEDVAQDVFISFYRGHPADAAVCWGYALWDAELPPPEWLHAWLRAEPRVTEYRVGPLFDGWHGPFDDQ